MAYEDGHAASMFYVARDGTPVVPTGCTLTIESGGAFSNAGSLVFSGTQTFDDIVGNDTSLGITGLAVTASTGGAVVVTGGATTTSGVGGAVTLTGGVGAGTDLGGAATLTGGVGGSTGAVGGAATVTAGAGTATSNGAIASLIGGASGGGATGNGGAVAVRGGAAVSTAGNGGAVTVTGGVSTTTGTGGAVTLTGGASVGASGTGGSINLASGAPAGGADGGVNIQTVTTGKVGFFGVTAVVRQSAYTQTYATADKTHSNPTGTSVVTTGVTQTTPWGYASEAQGNAVATTINAIIVDVADVKALVNSVIDDLQAYGLCQ